MKLYYYKNFKCKQKSKKLLEEVLKDYMENAEENTCNFEILKASGGKPYVNDKNIYFNISHSGNYWICGIGNKPLGVDIEIITENDHDKLVDKYFSNEEKTYLNKGKLNNKKDCFYEIWTLKEAYSKLLGESIFKNLKFNTISNGDLKSFEDIKSIETSQSVKSRDSFKNSNDILNMKKIMKIYFKKCNCFVGAKCTLAKAGEKIDLEIREIKSIE